MIKVNGKQTRHLLSRCLWLGGSIGGTTTGVLKDVALGFAICAERTEAGLPVEVERTEGAWSIYPTTFEL